MSYVASERAILRMQETCHARVFKWDNSHMNAVIYPPPRQNFLVLFQPLVSLVTVTKNLRKKNRNVFHF